MNDTPSGGMSPTGEAGDYSAKAIDAHLKAEDVRLKRFHEVPTLVRDLGYSNHIVRAFIQAYIHEEILTLQEALCRMVIELAKSREDAMKQLIEFHERGLPPIILSSKDWNTVNAIASDKCGVSVETKK